MSFDLEVRFTGICAFVPNLDTTPGAYRMCLVMPGGDGARFALDDELLCPHTSWIESPDGSVTLPKTPLRGMRVRFNVTFEDPSTSSEVEFPTGGGVDLADLEKVCGDYLNLDPAIFSFPPRGDIMTQVLLREGELDYYANETQWDIDPPLTGGTATKNQTLTHEVILHLNLLSKATLVLEPYTGGLIEISLAPSSGGGGLGKVRLANGCKDARPSVTSEQALRDRDFKWYYELMDEATRLEIVADLGTQSTDLPLPRYSHAHLLGGQDCFPVRSAAVNFNSPGAGGQLERARALLARRDEGQSE